MLFLSIFHDKFRNHEFLTFQSIRLGSKSFFLLQISQLKKKKKKLTTFHSREIILGLGSRLFSSKRIFLDQRKFTFFQTHPIVLLEFRLVCTPVHRTVYIVQCTYIQTTHVLRIIVNLLRFGMHWKPGQKNTLAQNEPSSLYQMGEKLTLELHKRLSYLLSFSPSLWCCCFFSVRTWNMHLYCFCSHQWNWTSYSFNEWLLRPLVSRFMH